MENLECLLDVVQHLIPGNWKTPANPPSGGAGPSGNHYQTPENSPRPVGSGAPSPMSEGSSQQGSPMSPPSLRRWLRRNFRETLIVDGVSSSASLLSTPNSSLQATPVQPMPESTVGPSTPGPKTPELPGRSVKRLFEDKKK
jgi:hypothetical protein